MSLPSLLQSKLVLAILVLVVLIAGVGGAFALGILGTPSIKTVDNRFAGVNETTTIIETDLVVNNPNPLGASLGGLTVDYAIVMNDVPMANGTKEGISVESGNSTLTFSTYMDNERIPAWWVSHIRNGEHTTLKVNADIHSATVGRSFSAPQITRDIDTNIIGAFNSSETRPLNANKEPLIQDPVLYLNSTSGSWGEVSLEKTVINMQFTIYNPKDYPIRISEIGYDIRMNNISIGAGQTSQAYTLPPGETTTVEATTRLQTQKLDEWWVSHLKRDQRTRLAIDFYMRFDLSAAGGGTVRIPFDTLTQTIETDFFGNKPEESGETTPTPDETATPTEGNTPTPTPTTETTTSTETTSTETTSSETTTNEETTTTPTATDTTTTSDGLL